uniref:Protamine-2 n=1 Tax=Macrostomum lignano TaxID=282301 RepID=A0A1I8H0C3_9PLAT
MEHTVEFEQEPVELMELEEVTWGESNRKCSGHLGFRTRCPQHRRCCSRPRRRQRRKRCCV